MPRMSPQQDLALSELSTSLRRAQDKWWKALISGEYVWAAYYANDILSAAQRLSIITHNYVKEHYADPKAALAGNPRTGTSPEEGDRG